MVKFYRKHYSLCFKCMRITTLLIGIQACFTTVLQAGSTDAQTINLDVRQANLKQVFVNIEKQANVTFVYNDRILQGLPEITIKAANKPLEEILKSISAKVPLQFKQAGNVIGVARANEVPHQVTPEKIQPVNPQPPIKITGRVLDVNGEPISGVSVILKNTNIAAITDGNGEYAIQAESSGTLIFSYVGFIRQELLIGGRDRINVTLAASVSPLDEVRVIAYGTTTQR